MLRTVIFHRRVQKKLKEKLRPVASQVVECVKSLSAGQTDHLGLRMKRLRGIDRPVFEARVNDDVRLIFTVQTAKSYHETTSAKDRLLDQIIVWDVDHHDDALNAARRISYDALLRAEYLNLSAALHEEGVCEGEIPISRLPQCPTVPISAVERATRPGESVLEHYMDIQRLGEEWWTEALPSKQETLYDAQEFWTIDPDRVEEELERIAQSDEDFLLRLLPEQMKFVRNDDSPQKPLLLKGTVGSGKTTIMLYHLYRRARTNPAGRYLVVTYSPTLTSLCQLLFEHLPHGRELLGRVDILSYEDLLRRWFPDTEIVSYTERRKQFHKAYQRAEEGWKRGNLKEPLKSWKRDHKEFPWDEETLWAEYWDVVKGQLNWNTREPLDREGYLHNAASALQVAEREAVFAAIETWFRLEGLDELDLSRQLWENRASISAQYDGVYVDEVQDLCEVQWMLLLRLVYQPAGLFLTGDDFQALRPSGFHWKRLVSRLEQAAGVQEGSLGLNLRNSRQIAQFVQAEVDRLFDRYASALRDRRSETRKPEYPINALIEGISPAYLLAEHAIPEHVISWFGNQGALIVWDEADKESDLAQDVSQKDGVVVTVDEAKGLEFDRAALYNVYKNLHEVMESGLKREVRVVCRQAFSRFFVALTRARRGLLIIDQLEVIPPNLYGATQDWFQMWNAAEPVTVRSIEAAKCGYSIIARAKKLREDGNYLEAAQLFEQAQQYDLAAECYELAEEWLKAAECYKRANMFGKAGRCYENAGLYAQAIDCYAQAGLYSEAARVCVEIEQYSHAAQYFRKAGDLMRAGECYEKAEDYANAGICFEEAGALDRAKDNYLRAQDTRSAWRCDAKMYEQKRQFAEAGAYYEKAEVFAHAAECYKRAHLPMDAARCYEKLKEWVKAAECYKQAGQWEDAARCYDLAQQFADAAECYEKAGLPGKAAERYARVERWEDAARCYEIAGEIKQAAECYKRAGNLSNAAKCYKKLRDFVTAATLFEQAGKIEEAAESYQLAGLYERAAECYDKTGKYAEAARLYEQLGRYEDAIRCYEHAQMPADAWRCRGERAYQARRYTEAGNCFWQAGLSERAGDSYQKARKWLKAADSYKLAEKFVEAARCYEKVEKVPEFLQAAECYEKAGELVEAGRCYQLAEKPSKAGECYERAGELVKAKRCYAEAMEWESAGRCAEALGNYNEAAENYLRAKMYRRAAECYAKSGRFGEAAACYEKLGDFEKASLCYRKAGQDIDAYRCLAIFEERRRRFHEAAEAYKKTGMYAESAACYRLVSDFVNAAVCWETIHEYERAAEDYRRAGRYKDEARCLGRLWEHADPYRAARCYEQAGLPGDAARCYEKARAYVTAWRLYEQAGMRQNAERCRKLALQQRR